MGEKQQTLTTDNLADHPYFTVPEAPELQVDRGTAHAIIEWTLLATAEFISPPKEDGEDNEFPCEDIAGAIRGPLRDILWAKMGVNMTCPRCGHLIPARVNYCAYCGKKQEKNR